MFLYKYINIPTNTATQAINIKQFAFKKSEIPKIAKVNPGSVASLSANIPANCGTKYVNMNIKTKMEINSYQGTRHKKGLPVRGQRTNRNARTRKGKGKVVANKKK